MAFPQISLENLVLHTLLDQYEFSAHSFESAAGPYFWNGIGIDFQSPFPKSEVMQHAKKVSATHLYLAHTHPLSNDDSLNFMGTKVDPREKIAFGKLPLPLGNGPSEGDIRSLSKFQRYFGKHDITITGVVFAASGIWEFSIDDESLFEIDGLSSALDSLRTTEKPNDFFREWAAKGNFPNYAMELEKPGVHTPGYKLHFKNATPPLSSDISPHVNQAIKVFRTHGVKLKFKPHQNIRLDPTTLMTDTLLTWNRTFN